MYRQEKQKAKRAAVNVCKSRERADKIFIISRSYFLGKVA